MSPMRQIAGHALIAGAITSAYGWLVSGVGISDSAFYNAMVDLFYATLRIGGGLLLLVAVLCHMQKRVGLLLDAGITILMGGVILLYAASGLLAGLGVSVNDIIIGLFGAMFLSSARASWRVYLEPGGRAAPPPPFPSSVEQPAHPVAPASPPRSPPPKEPPPEGYLAALAREEDDAHP